MTGQTSDWRGQILFRGGQALLAPHWRRRWNHEANFGSNEAQYIQNDNTFFKQF